MSAPGDPGAQLRAIGTAYVRFAIANPAHYRVMFGCTRKDEEEFPELHAAGNACFLKLIGATQQRLGSDATALQVRDSAVTCWSAVHGLATLFNDGPLEGKFEGANLEDLLDAVLDKLLIAIKGADEA